MTEGIWKQKIMKIIMVWIKKIKNHLNNMIQIQFDYRDKD
jgi:hypothetical protein